MAWELGLLQTYGCRRLAVKYRVGIPKAGFLCDGRPFGSGFRTISAESRESPMYRATKDEPITDKHLWNLFRHQS